MNYLIRWEIELEANSPREAAQQAKLIQQDPESIANVFYVDPVIDGYDYDVHTDNFIDLDEEDTAEQDYEHYVDCPCCR